MEKRKKYLVKNFEKLMSGTYLILITFWNTCNITKNFKNYEHKLNASREITLNLIVKIDPALLHTSVGLRHVVCG